MDSLFFSGKLVGMASEEPKFLVDVISTKYLPQFGSLLDRSFGVPEGMHFLDDFPVWDEELGVRDVLRVGVFSGELLVTSACVRLARLRTIGSRTIPVSLIGAVATDENWRGHGLASQAVSMVLQWAEEKGSVLSILWGSEHSLYQKLGFEPCGEQVRVPISSFIGNSGDRALPYGVHEGWHPRIFDLMRQRQGGLLLEEPDRRWLEAHKHVQWFWAGPADAPKAYAALGRGIDLTGFIHEWGGDRDLLRGIFFKIHSLHPAAALLGGPSVLKQYGFVFPEDALEYLCLAKIHDASAVVQGFSPSGSGSREVPETVLNALSPAERARLFFGPVEEGKRLPDPFPMPLWVWGLDAA